MGRRIALWCTVAVLAIMFGGSLSYAKESRDIKFAVFSDPHFYSKSLGTTGTAFNAYLMQDRKLLRESESILDAAINAIIEEGKVKFVLVPGDLTKDGERLNHFLFALKMKKLERAGIQVFVVPGNHDINNLHAFRYVDNSTESVPNVSPKMFRWIYNDFGYRQSIRRDPNSLSYVVEPSPGVWLIAMDTCDYDRNEIEGYPATRGRFKPETLEWVLEMARQGKLLGKQLIGMMHHGVVEHYTGQTLFFADYVVENFTNVGKQLATAGLQVVFTGHFHANDVAVNEFEGAVPLFDIETGSLVTSPCPVRFVTVKPNRMMEIETSHITKIKYDTEGKPFSQYAEDFLTDGLKMISDNMLESYGFPTSLIDSLLTPNLVAAYKAHYSGDEDVLAQPETYSQAINLLFKIGQTNQAALGLAFTLQGLWNDSTPDNYLMIDLKQMSIVEE